MRIKYQENSKLRLHLPNAFPALTLTNQPKSAIPSLFPAPLTCRRLGYRDSQYPNSEMAKSHGSNVSPPAQQKGSKNVQSGHSQNMLTSTLTKGNTTYDEFKYGFPSEGLSTASNKWWGSNSPDGNEGLRGKGAKTEEDKKPQSDKLADDNASSIMVDTEKPESGKDENISPQGTDLLVSVRRRAVEENQKALKLGAFRGYGAKKLGRRERKLLLRIFKSSTPKQWIHDSS
ncbi:hypothetical protein ACFX13_025064 [Malus domestica]